MKPDYTNVVPAVYLLLIKENKIVLIRRFNTGYEDGSYSLIAGHVDEGEDVFSAMVREAKEEANIELKTEDLQVVHTMYRKGPSNMRVDFFITTKIYQGTLTNMEPEKCDDMQWFDLNNLPTNTIPCVRQAIECYQNNITFSEFGWE